MELRLNAVRQFAFSNDSCRVASMLRYFGETDAKPCGKCDVCREKAKQNRSVNNNDILRQQILYLASHNGGTDLNQLITVTNTNAETVISTVRQLIDVGLLTSDGQFLSAKR